MDPSERFFFAASNTGSIHQVNLFSKRADVVSSRAMEAVGGGGMSDIIRLADDEAGSERLISVE